jgi:serine protease Do
MKKRIYQALLIGIICLTIGQLTMAQPAAPPPPPPAPSKTEINEKSDQKEIIIRQKGEKDTKLTLEIKNGDFFINGKPLEKFDDQNIIVEKRDIDNDEEPVLVYTPSPFRNNDWNEDRLLEMRRSQEDMQRSQRELQRSQQNMQRSFRIKVSVNAAFLGISSKRTDKGGATVIEVTKGSPAEKAGIKLGDIITKVNDTKIANPDSLYETIHNYKPGDKVKIFFTRAGKEQNVMVTLDKSEDFNQKNFNYNYNFKMPYIPDMGDMEMNGWNFGRPKLGIKAQDAEDGKGVDVLQVEDSSAAAKAGLKKGDVILQVDGKEVNNVNELVDRTTEMDSQKYTLLLKIQRNGVAQDINIKIPRKLKTAEL